MTKRRALRKRLRRGGTDLIAPHRRGRVKVPLQDGRKLRRYRRRKIERTIAWVQNFRRVAVRYDRSISMLNAQIQIAGTSIAVKIGYEMISNAFCCYAIKVSFRAVCGTTFSIRSQSLAPMFLVPV